MYIRLYEWQEECLSLWLKNRGRGIVNVATGAGKTVFALAAAVKLAEMPDRQCLKVKIIVPKTFLVHQWAQAIREELLAPREEIGVFSGTRKDRTDRRFMIYVINSARYSLARHMLEDFQNGNPVLLIADECHHYGTEENARIFDFIPYMTNPGLYYALGLSATPFCPHYTDVLAPALGKEIYRFTFTHALEAGIISQFAVFHIRLRFNNFEEAEYADLSEQISVAMIHLRKKCPQLHLQRNYAFFETLEKIISTYSDTEAVDLAKSVLLLSYRRKEIVYRAKARTKCVADLIKLIHKNAKIIIFGERIEMAEDIYEKLCVSHPNEAGIYHSGLHKTVGKTALRKFEDAETRILVSCKTLDEGLNVTETDVGIIVSSTNSKRQRVQRLGRVLRKKKTERTAYFYYLYVGGTTEETDILRDITDRLSPKVTAIDLYYEDTTGTFSNPYYDALAEEVVDRALEKGWNDAEIAELIRNINKGLITCDWWLTEKSCMEKIEHAASKTERNYYITMLYLIRERYKQAARSER